MNYFNYFTEIEERFQQARQSSLFLLSPLDWALIESWREAGVPLEAVLRGIDRAFEKWHRRKHRARRVNSLAYCTQEVLAAAQELAEGSAARQSNATAQPDFLPGELAAYFRRNAHHIRRCSASLPAALHEVCEKTAGSLEKLAEEAEQRALEDMEDTERRLTVLEERLYGVVLQHVDDEEVLAARREMEQQLAPYRGKMSAEQLALLERQYLQRKQLEKADLPRLSLFYLYGG